MEAGRALVVAVNKWDSVDDYRRERIKEDIARKLPFLGFARFLYVSALKGQGIVPMLKAVDGAYEAAMTKLSTPKLTRLLLDTIVRQQPPRHGGFRPKMRYAHQGGMNPPVIVVHGSALDHVPPSYVRFLERSFQEAFKLQGTPLRIQFKSSHNPYANKD